VPGLQWISFFPVALEGLIFTELVDRQRQPAASRFGLASALGLLSVFEPPPSETPSTKVQRDSKSQTPNLESDAGANGAQVGFRDWSLVLLWGLEVGTWELFAGLPASENLRIAPPALAAHIKIVAKSCGSVYLKRL